MSCKLAAKIDRTFKQSLTGRCPQLAVTREWHHKSLSTAALAAWLHWLVHLSGSDSISGVLCFDLRRPTCW